jgi:hypothetical protein
LFEDDFDGRRELFDVLLEEDGFLRRFFSFSD